MSSPLQQITPSILSSLVACWASSQGFRVWALLTKVSSKNFENSCNRFSFMEKVTLKMD